MSSSWDPHNNPRSRGRGAGRVAPLVLTSESRILRHKEVKEPAEGTEGGSGQAPGYGMRSVCTVPPRFCTEVLVSQPKGQLSLSSHFWPRFCYFTSLSCSLLIGWLLGHQSIASGHGCPFTSLSSGPGSLRKTVRNRLPEGTRPGLCNVSAALKGKCRAALQVGTTVTEKQESDKGKQTGVGGLSEKRPGLSQLLSLRSCQGAQSATSMGGTKVSQGVVTKAMQKPARLSGCLQLCKRARCPASEQGGG